MPLDLDPHPCDDAAPPGDGIELVRVLHALADGDAAFVLTLVERFGAAIAAELQTAGVPAVDLDARVHDVAFALLGAPVDPDDEPWTAVRRAVVHLVDPAAAPRQEETPHVLRGRVAIGIVPSGG